MIKKAQVIVDISYLNELEKFRDSFMPDLDDNKKMKIDDIIKIQVAKEAIKMFLDEAWRSLLIEKGLDREGRGAEYSFAMDTIAKLKKDIGDIDKIRNKYDAKKRKEQQEKEEQE